MAASLPAAGACGHRSLAPISSPATQPPCRLLLLLLHSLQNQAVASECSSSKGEGKGGEEKGREGERRARRGGRREEGRS